MGTGSKTGVRGQGSGRNRPACRTGRLVPRVRKATAPYALFYVTNNGRKLALRIRTLLSDARVLKFTSVRAVHELPLYWNECKGLIFIMATGIVVRSIASLMQDKRTDPAVLVLDEQGEFVISLLSGHIGGANALTGQIADYLGARAVITTASDVQGKIALDLWAAEHNLFVEDNGKLRDLSAKIVNGGTVRVFSELTFRPKTVPDEFRIIDAAEQADVIISSRMLESNALFLRPRNLIVGIGCNRGTHKDEIAAVVAEIMMKKKLSLHSIKSVASIDLKKNEKGLLAYARENRLTIAFFSKDDLNHAASKHKLTRSKAALAATGAAAVAEPAALMAARTVSDNYSLIEAKQKRGNVTLAIAKAEFSL
jgi:cobalamin biosynthesis protein CbiG